MSYRRFAPLLPLALLLAVLLAGCQDHPLPTAAPVTPGETPLLLQVPAFTYEEVSANYSHTCARKSDGSVVCWGWNLHQQTSVPTGLGAVTQVSAGSSHTCAIRQSDSKVACWGSNFFGQTNVPADLGAVTQVSAGGRHTCAIRQSDGNAVCWGDNSVQQTSVPPSLGAVRQVATGWEHTCAIRQSDDNVVCWGWNSNGQRDVPADLGAVTQVGAGSLYTCAIRQSDDNVACWGGNEFGQTNVPAGLGAVAQIEAGSEHACAVKSNGSVACWGWNSNGQTNVPADLGSVTQVGAAQRHTCVRKSDGHIACWGDNSEGRLNVPARPTITVYPTAIFSAPATVVVEETFTLTLSDAQVPGYSGPVTFTYAFDCGDGSGYGTASSTASVSCPTSTAGSLSVRGKVIDQAGDYTQYSATVEVAAPVVALSASSLPFGNVDVGGSSALIVTITNNGNAPLSVSGLSIPGGAPFAITSAPLLPADLAPSENVDVQVTFAPTATGAFTGTLNISSNDPAQPQLSVALSGTGMPVAPPPGNGVEQVLAFIQAAVDAGTLVGEGNGASAQNRLNALRNMLTAASDLLLSGDLAGGCGQLLQAQRRTDGLPQPPDFVAGAAAPMLAAQIQALRGTLGCP